MTHEPFHHEHDHEHDFGPLAELITLRDWLRYAVSRFNRADLHFGHGCSDAYDEAAWLLLHSLALPLDRLEPFLDASITAAEREQLHEIIERRVTERIPSAYLVNEAWLGGFRFYVDPRAIVPRSFFAELLDDGGLEPWLPSDMNSALDLCTGSGCLAILMAHVFPDVDIVAADLSEDALAVAQRNIEDYGLRDRIERVKTDLFSALSDRRFDLIVTNPPYVTQASMEALPAEYRHEPQMALAAGEDGMEIVRRILVGARSHLTSDGVLAVEVGHNRMHVEAAFPDLPLVWLPTSGGNDMVFLVQAQDLPAS
ncbi:MAG TPA: 50S ribosomal protein L3 N(5)-glutamine methyltransferase [Azoarcus sp.]|nr:50S ribosomal protein L3 N(5)-glutamine methyltransferase [Azoarcus sp.]